MREPLLSPRALRSPRRIRGLAAGADRKAARRGRLVRLARTPGGGPNALRRGRARPPRSLPSHRRRLRRRAPAAHLLPGDRRQEVREVRGTSITASSSSGARRRRRGPRCRRRWDRAPVTAAPGGHASLGGDGGPRERARWGRRAPRVAAVAAVADLVGFAALAIGSLRARTPLLVRGPRRIALGQQSDSRRAASAAARRLAQWSAGTNCANPLTSGRRVRDVLSP